MYNIDLTALVTSHQPKLFSLLLESLHLCPTKGLAWQEKYNEYDLARCGDQLADILS